MKIKHFAGIAGMKGAFPIYPAFDRKHGRGDGSQNVSAQHRQCGQWPRG